MKILIVEDEMNIAQLIQQILEEEGFSCYCFYDGFQALKGVEKFEPELIILDRMLPGMDGLEVCAQLRQKQQEKDPYILMLTAKGEELDRIIGLSTGADDYMVKPFSSRELVARVRALLRRKLRQCDPQTIYQTQHFTVDLTSRTAKRQLEKEGNETLSLTNLEFNLLAAFVSYPNRVWTRTQLIERLWGQDFYGDERVVDTQMARLRKKVEPDAGHPIFIKTVMGVGYKLEDNRV